MDVGDGPLPFAAALLLPLSHSLPALLLSAVTRLMPLGARLTAGWLGEVPRALSALTVAATASLNLIKTLLKQGLTPESDVAVA